MSKRHITFMADGDNPYVARISKVELMKHVREDAREALIKANPPEAFMGRSGKKRLHIATRKLAREWYNGIVSGKIPVKDAVQEPVNEHPSSA